MLIYYEFTLPNYDINNTRFEKLEFCSMKLSSRFYMENPDIYSCIYQLSCTTLCFFTRVLFLARMSLGVY